MKRINSINLQLSSAGRLVNKFSDVFEGLGCISRVVHHIKLDPNATPVVHPPRRILVAMREKVRIELCRLEREGVISKVQEPTT